MAIEPIESTEEVHHLGRDRDPTILRKRDSMVSSFAATGVVYASDGQALPDFRCHNFGHGGIRPPRKMGRCVRKSLTD